MPDDDALLPRPDQETRERYVSIGRDAVAENLAALRGEDTEPETQYPPGTIGYEIRFHASGTVGQGTAPEPPIQQGETP